MWQRRSGLKSNKIKYTAVIEADIKLFAVIFSIVTFPIFPPDQDRLLGASTQRYTAKFRPIIL
jgi:hypothetical protein